MMSRNANGPTIRRVRNGSSRRTVPVPTGRSRGSMISSMASTVSMMSARGLTTTALPGQPPGANSMTCWNVGRFVAGSRRRSGPGAKVVRPPSLSHVVGSSPSSDGESPQRPRRPPPTARRGRRRGRRRRSTRTVERSVDRLAEQGPEVLVDDALGVDAAELDSVVERQSPSTGSPTASTIGSNTASKIERPGRVVVAVVVGVEQRRVVGDPVVEDRHDLGGELGRCVTAGEHLADHRPHRRANVLGRRPVHHPDDVGRARTASGHWSKPSTRWTDPYWLLSPCMKPGCRLVVPVEQASGRVAVGVRMLVLFEEPLPLVLAGAERRQPTVEPLGAHRQQAGGEVADAVPVGVAPVEREPELVRDLEELVLASSASPSVMSFSAPRLRPSRPNVDRLAGERDRRAVGGGGADHRAVHRHRVADRDVAERAGVELLERDARRRRTRSASTRASAPTRRVRTASRRTRRARPGWPR